MKQVSSPVRLTNDRLFWILGTVVLVALAMSFMLVRSSAKERSNYQAIFLTNGQVYFGQVKNERANPVIVRDIYYLRVQRQLQPPPENPEEAQAQVKLVKLGSELHGPVDEMRINRDQILFIEDLKISSKVVTAIRDHQAQQN